MAKTNKTQTVDGLDRLKEAVKDFHLRVPKIRDLPKLNREDLRATVEQKIAACHQIQEDVANALKYLADVRRLVAEQTDRIARKIVESETATSAAEMREYLEDVLGLEDPVYRQSAALSYVKSALSQELTDIEEAQEVLREIERHGLLAKADHKGPIMIGYQRYQLGDGLEEEDVKELSGVLAKFSRCLMALVRQQRQKKAKEMFETSDIDLAEALGGANGTCAMHVPSEYKEDQGKWLAGGDLLVNFLPKEVVPVAGVGAIENAVKGMAAIDVRLPRFTLDWSTPPGSGGAFKRVQAGVMETRRLSEKDAEAYVNKMKALWWLIHRSKKALKHKEATEELKEEFRQKADITPQEFFRLNGSGMPLGDKECLEKACLEFQGAFHQKGAPSVYNLFFLASRGREEGADVFEIVEVPRHLEGFLGGFVGKRFLVADNFKNCPGRLRNVMQGIRSHIDLAHEIGKEA